MKKNFILTLSPEIAFDEEKLQSYFKRQLKLNDADEFHLAIQKRSVDARQKNIKVNLNVDVYIDELPQKLSIQQFNYKPVSTKKTALIVGAGPAGLFAALRLIELGICPIIFERGKDVQERRRDLANINKKNLVNENSNYCFGEGGAGTYSDGKLYTRSTKRGDIRRILEIMVAHGANESILYEAHPHIGTNKLPKLISAIRQTIEQCGGKIYFNHKVSDFIIKNKTIKGVVVENIETNTITEFLGDAVLLATGHSARDIFELLAKHQIEIENKPFALGVRVEHQQQFINGIQYHQSEQIPFLPAASYALVHNVEYKNSKKGIFSFCMCPGGFVVPAATAQNEIVVNGMSPSKRDSAYANSGIVVSIDENDWKPYKEFGALAALEFQKSVEQKAWSFSQTQMAPAQLLQDFISNHQSSNLLPTSYQPGLFSVSMQEVLPKSVAFCLKEGFKNFNLKMKGFVSNQAQIIGVESRTSSPVKIPRNPETLEHISHKNLYPCAEGAGYAGGIMSAAIDGERCAEKIAEKLSFG